MILLNIIYTLAMATLVFTAQAMHQENNLPADEIKQVENNILDLYAKANNTTAKLLINGAHEIVTRPESTILYRALTKDSTNLNVCVLSHLVTQGAPLMIPSSPSSESEELAKLAIVKNTIKTKLAKLLDKGEVAAIQYRTVLDKLVTAFQEYVQRERDEFNRFTKPELEQQEE